MFHQTIVVCPAKEQYTAVTVKGSISRHNMINIIIGCIKLDMICFVLNILFRWDSVQGYRLEQKISHWLILTLWIKVHDGMCQSEQDVIYSALMGTCQCPSPLWFLSFQWIILTFVLIYNQRFMLHNKTHYFHTQKSI